MNLYDAIFLRKSIRSYYMDEIEQNTINQILNFANHISVFSNENNVEFKILNNTKMDIPIARTFSVKAPYYLIIASENKEDYLLNAGYIMEQLSLYLTTKNIGSCFLNTINLKKEIIKDLKYEYITMLAFGKSKESLYEDKKKMKKIEETGCFVFKEEVNDDMRLMLTSVQLCPSVMYNKPWRFVVYENRIHIFCKRNLLLSKVYDFTKQIDIGIILSHLLVTAEELWLDTTVKKLDNISNKSFKNNEYVISVLIK